MKDVAEMAGVSKQTVSAVINDKPGITGETRHRVQAAIDQLGYRPLLTARSLRTGQTRTIALILADVSSPVAGKMASAAEDYAYAARYNLVLYNTHDDVERERFYISSVIQRSVDGALFVSAQDNSTGPQMLQAAGIPAVVIDRVPRSYSGPTVVLDNIGAGRTAGEHVANLGHRRTAHIGGPSNVHIARERLAGFRQVLEASGSGSISAAETAQDWRIESGYEAMQRLLRGCREFTAVFAAGDLLAIGAMRALREARLRVPDDVSVIGIDDIDIAAFLWPPLTTVCQSIAHMATVGVQLLLDILQGKEVPGQTVIEPRLILRESPAPPPVMTATGHPSQGR